MMPASTKAPVRFVFLFAALCVWTTVTLKIPESASKDRLKNLSHLEPKEAHLETPVEEPPALLNSIEPVTQGLTKQVAELEAKLNRSNSKVQTLTSENAKLVKSNLKLQKQKTTIQSLLHQQKEKYQKLEAKHQQKGQGPTMQSQKRAKTMGRHILAVGRSRHRLLRRGQQPKNGAVMPLVLLSSKSGTSFDVVEQAVEQVHGITIGGPGVKVCTGSYDCPTGDVCDIKCADGKCSHAQFTGVFRNMVCGSGACKNMKVVKVTGNAKCKGKEACRGAKGFEVGGNFGCDGQKACYDLQTVVKVKGSATCTGKEACRGAKGFEVGGNFGCDGPMACWSLKEVVKVKGSATCTGKEACRYAKGFEVGGNFGCDGQKACYQLQTVAQVTGSATCKGLDACRYAKGFEVGGNFGCDGQNACLKLQTVVKVKGSATCKGQLACNLAKGFEVGGNFGCDGLKACWSLKEVVKVKGSATCKGQGACGLAKGFEVGGNFGCDGKNSCNQLQTVVKVKGNATCNGEDTCIHAKGFEVGGNFGCDGLKACWSLKEVVKAYSMSATTLSCTEHPQDQVNLNCNAKKNCQKDCSAMQKRVQFEVFRKDGQIQAWTTKGLTNADINLYNKASSPGVFRANMQDYNFGYQALAIAARDREDAGLEAGPATISGTVTVEPGWQFYLQEGARPTGKSSFLVPAVSKSQKTLQFTTLNISDDGHAFIDNPGMSRAAILSLSSVFYPGDPSNKTNGNFTSQTYKMGNGAFVCTLSGTQSLSVGTGAGAKTTLLKLDPKCTEGYKEAGFQVAAQVSTTDGKLLLNVERPEYQIALTEDDELILSVSSSATESKVILSLDGLVFASADSKKPLPEPCYPPSQPATLGSTPCLSKSFSADAARAACPIFGESLLGCANNLCNYECKPDVQVNTNTTVKGTTERLFPQDSVVGPSHLVIMGKSIAERTCALRGVVKFTKVGDASNASWIAQIDPNLRDPTLRTPLCFPMATMIFYAGVVADEAGKEIKSLVAIQIEPHGRIRVISETGTMSGSTTLYLRLDGITYRPLSKFLTTPNECVPYCFDESNSVPSTSLMSGTSCTKYCTPSEIDPKTMKSVECKCDLVKRIECWARGKTTNIRCGQFKKLMGMRMTGMNNMTRVNAKCALTCARQLAIL